MLDLILFFVVLIVLFFTLLKLLRLQRILSKLENRKSYFSKKAKEDER
ncbi:MAG: hypothetical protein J1D99_03510 [Campylobacter sp.]|nr:hypothetical protein [Campylobacter sp.]